MVPAVTARSQTLAAALVIAGRDAPGTTAPRPGEVGGRGGAPVGGTGKTARPGRASGRARAGRTGGTIAVRNPVRATPPPTGARREIGVAGATPTGEPARAGPATGPRIVHPGDAGRRTVRSAPSRGCRSRR
jgi:hypothetical protein